MKKLLVILILALIPSFAFGATATATVGGTLKVYQTLAAATVNNMIFPAQFAIASLASPLINVDGQAPATGIPAVAGDTIGQAGKVSVTGTGQTAFTASIATPMTLSGPSTINTVALALYGDAAFSAAAPTAIPGSGNGQIAYVYVKGTIPSATQLVAGTYIGSALLTVTYN